jgi:hypothetical protein
LPPAITRASIELCSTPFNASARRADPFGASGLDRASAQLWNLHLRDGRQEPGDHDGSLTDR